jgi:ribosomal protein S18 acetylase RimI-like enzyme
MDAAQLLSAYNSQVRMPLGPDPEGGIAEQDGDVIRWVAPPGDGASCIIWSQLTASTADAAIAAQVAFFGARGSTGEAEFEWKLYDYDQPPDLGRRLEAAGFTPDDPEAVMVAEVADQAAEVALPDGLRLQPVTGDAGVEALIEVHGQVFGGDQSQLRNSLLGQVRNAPELMAMVLAVAGQQPVSAARVNFLPGTDFAGLWGGGTLPAWRGRGIYRALVAYRARLAAERGYRYLNVDASADSEPILRRLGFRRLARTTPYVWTG